MIDIAQTDICRIYQVAIAPLDSELGRSYLLSFGIKAMSMIYVKLILVCWQVGKRNGVRNFRIVFTEDLQA